MITITMPVWLAYMVGVAVFVWMVGEFAGLYVRWLERKLLKGPDGKEIAEGMRRKRRAG